MKFWIKIRPNINFFKRVLFTIDINLFKLIQKDTIVHRKVINCMLFFLGDDIIKKKIFINAISDLMTNILMKDPLN